MADELPELVGNVDLERERARSRAATDGDRARDRSARDHVDIAIGVEIGADQREVVARRRTLADQALGEPPAAVVHEQQHLLGGLEEQRGNEHVDVAIAIAVDELHAGNARALVADLRHAVLKCAHESAGFVADDRDAPAAHLVDHEIEVAIRVHVGRGDDARIRDAAEEGREPHAVGALE